MPTQKYRVDTDKGSYEVEVEAPQTGDHSTETGNWWAGAANSVGRDIKQGVLGVTDAVNPMKFYQSMQEKNAADDKMVADAKGSFDDQGHLKPGQFSPSNVLPNLKTMAANTTNPLADPRTVGNLVGGALVGKYAPELGSPVVKGGVRLTGKALQAAGDNPFAARLAGGAAVVSGLYKGDPELVAAGAAGAAMPPALSAMGRKLRMMSGESPAVVKLGPDGVAKINGQFDEAMVKRGMKFRDEQDAAAAAASNTTAAEDALLLRQLGTPEAVAKFKAQGITAAAPKVKPGAPGDVPNNPVAQRLEAERQDVIKPSADLPNSPAAAKVELARQPTPDEIAAERRVLSGIKTQPKAVPKVEPLSQPQLDKATEMNLKNSPVFKDFIDSGAANGDRTNGTAGLKTSGNAVDDALHLRGNDLPIPTNSRGVVSENDLLRLSKITGVKVDLLRKAKITPNAMDEFLTQRADAQQSYRINAGMNKGAADAAGRDSGANFFTRPE